MTLKQPFKKNLAIQDLRLQIGTLEVRSIYSAAAYFRLLLGFNCCGNCNFTTNSDSFQYIYLGLNNHIIV